MTSLQLTSEEERILTEVLERSTRDLELEVGHTDSREFKVMLKRRREVIEQLLKRVHHSPVAA